MPEIKIHETKSFENAGNLLINSRSIIRVGDLFSRVHDRANSNKQISVDELSELLVLLESIATSCDLYFDGTIPQKDADLVSVAERDIEDRVGSNLFDPAKPETDKDLLNMCVAGICQSAPILIDSMEAFNRSPDAPEKTVAGVRPLGEDKDPADFIRRMSEPLMPEDERAEHALSVMKEPFNGGKCVAGLLGAHAEGSDDLDITQKSREFVTRHMHDDRRMRFIIPMFMNGFRANFLNTLGTEHARAAFFTGPEVGHVLDRQVPLLASYIAKRVGEENWHRLRFDEKTRDQMKTDINFPFLGLLIFLSGKPSEPYSVFEEALADRGSLRDIFLKKNGGRIRYIHGMDATELEEFTKGKLEKIYQRINNQIITYGRVLDFNHRYVCPILERISELMPFARVLQKTVGEGLGGLEGVEIATEIGEDIKAPYLHPETPELVNSYSYVVNRMFSREEDYANYAFIKGVSQRLEAILEDDDTSCIVADQTKDLFGMELVLRTSPG